MKYKYVEVVKFSPLNDEEIVVNRVDVSDKNQEEINAIEDGLNIGLNTTKYFTQFHECKKPLPVGKLLMVKE